MMETNTAVKEVRAALERDTAINLHRHPVDVTVEDGAVVLDGEVESIAAKRLALAHARGLNGFEVVDRLRIAPVERLGDGAVRDLYCGFLAAQGEFMNCGIRARDNGGMRVIREAAEAPEEWKGDIEVAVADGVITLEGHVISLSHQRLAEVFGWWTRGCRDVVNRLKLDPPERDNDEEVVEALSLVYEIDPELDADQIRVHSTDFVVRLDGFVASDGARRRAELDAWALCGVKRVDNHLQVRS